MSELFVLRLSRKREYWADAIGAALPSKVDMIAALEKLHQVPDLSRFERRHARLMFRGVAGGALFSTHPTLHERRSALEKETYLRRIPRARAETLPVVQVLTSDVPKADEIAYAKR